MTQVELRNPLPVLLHAYFQHGDSLQGQHPIGHGVGTEKVEGGNVSTGSHPLLVTQVLPANYLN